MRFSWRIRELNAVDSQDGAEVLDDRLKKVLPHLGSRSKSGFIFG